MVGVCVPPPIQRSLAAFHLAVGEFGLIEARTGVTVGRAQVVGLAEDPAAWTDDFYEECARDADEDLPDTDVIMMRGDSKGIARSPKHRKNHENASTARSGTKKMGEIVAVVGFTPDAREPEDIAAPPRPPPSAPRPGGPR